MNISIESKGRNCEFDNCQSKNINYLKQRNHKYKWGGEMKVRRKILLLFTCLFIVVLFPTLVSASETPLQLIFSNTQGALIVGIAKEVDKEKDQLTCEVIRVVSGSYNRSQITIDESTHYDSATNQEVYYQPGAGLVISINKGHPLEGDVEQVMHGVYQVKIKEHRKVKFEPCLTGDDALIEWYVNTGIKKYNYTYDNDYFGIGDEVLFDVKANTWYKDSLSPRYIAPDTQLNKVLIVFGVIIIGLVIPLIVVGRRYRKLKKLMKP